MTDTAATALRGLPWETPSSRDLAEAAAIYGWYATTPWFEPVPVNRAPAPETCGEH